LAFAFNYCATITVVVMASGLGTLVATGYIGAMVALNSHLIPYFYKAQDTEIIDHPKMLIGSILAALVIRIFVEPIDLVAVAIKTGLLVLYSIFQMIVYIRRSRQAKDDDPIFKNLTPTSLKRLFNKK
jgi:hypothetical protein